jgi:hypothetical protein
MGIPEIKANESATETSVLCERIFKAMGLQVSLMDIDIAHRVATRNPNSHRPKQCRSQNDNWGGGGGGGTYSYIRVLLY